MMFDNHVHLDHNAAPEQAVEYFNKFRNELEIEHIVLQSIPIHGEPNRLQNLKILMLKDMMYPYIFAGFGLWHGEGHDDFLTQLKQGLEQGFDSVKMLEGKPDKRKQTGLPLCDEKYDPFYSAIEEKGLPITLHLGDPKSNWDKSQVSEYALNAGWFYGLPGFCTLDELYAEVDEVLRKHPNLKFIMAHFYFMYYDLKVAAKFLDQHPNVFFDLTPGEHFEVFSNNTKEAQEFFIKYADRLVAGTDVKDQLVPNYHGNLYRMVIGMINGDPIPPFRNNTYNSLNLPPDVADKILRGNAYRIYGDTPKRNNRDAIKKEIQRLEGETALLSEVDLATLKLVKEYYEK